jgi:hypothetical protein
MTHNSSQQFGFGRGVPPIKNEAGFPVSDADAGVVTGPLPGMSMRFGDPLEELPAEAVEKFRKLELRRDEAHVLLQAAIESQQELQRDVTGDQARIKRLMQHPHEGGFGLADDAPQVAAEQKKLDRKRAEQRRLTALSEARGTIWKNAAELVRNIEQAVVTHSGGYVAEIVGGDAPTFKGNILDAVEGRRRRGRELQADLHRIRSSPWPSALAKQKMRERIEQLAESGRPWVEQAIENGAEIPFPTQTHPVRILNGGPGLIGFAELPDMLALMTWLHRDALIAALDREIAEVADDPSAMTHEQRQKAEAQIRADLLAVERQECALIEIAQAQGLPVEYRGDCDPRAILGFEWVAAPAPVPREGDGQAGVVRRVGP